MQVRCQEHGPPNGRKYDYVAAAEPLGYPETAILCARTEDGEPCLNPALIYLNRDEHERYREGKRVFGPPGRGIKFKVGEQITLTD